MNKVIFVALIVYIQHAAAGVDSGKSATVTLNDGSKIPIIGLGTYARNNGPQTTQKAVENAIDIGYRHFDTAAIYGSEEYIGKALIEKMKEGKIKREDVYITTKLWSTNHGEKNVVPALRDSLKKLQLEYVDQYLIHSPESFDGNRRPTNIDYLETWRGMEEAVKLGLTKSIGVSNFDEKQLERLLKSAKIKPVVNQVIVNPNRGQKSLIAFCKANDIYVVAYTPVGSMFESKAVNPSSPAPKLDDPILTEIGRKYKKNTVQVVLRYLIDRGLIPIPKSYNPTHMADNIDVFDFKLTQDEIEKIDKFNLD